jgi:DNA-binding MarR family transcriptional regulator
MPSRSNLLENLKGIEKVLGLRPVSLDFEILLMIYYGGDMAAGEIIKKIHASPASFNILSRKMRQAGLIVVQPGANDRRKNMYSISHEARTLLSKHLLPN